MTGDPLSVRAVGTAVSVQGILKVAGFGGPSALRSKRVFEAYCRMPATYVIYILSIAMRRDDEAALAEFVNDHGGFYGATLATEWRAPDSVDLSHGVLTIRSTRPYWNCGKAGRRIRPPRGLLDSFISLAGVSKAMPSLRALARGSTSSDEKIGAFATRYGGLQIFYRLRRATPWPASEHLEYCDVWRYFAHVAGALLRIAAELYQGRDGSPEDWEIIHKVPPVMRKTAHQLSPGLLHPFPEGDEETWLSLAHFAGKPSQQNRTMLGHLVNTLLGLGAVRPWFTWSEASRRGARPEMKYSSRSLLSQVALQLGLRLAKVDSFLMCIHCHQPYSPVVRAPKAGQRNFCQDCRSAGVPKRYALRDFRQRQRQSREGKPNPGKDTAKSG